MRPEVGLRDAVRRVGGALAGDARLQLVRQVGQRRQVEHGVDQLDDRVVVALLARGGVGAAIGRDQDQRDARPAGQRQAGRVEGEDARRHVVVVTLALVVGDDDGALVPVRAAGDGVDLAGDQRLRDLGVGVGRVVVVADEVGLHDRRLGVQRVAGREVGRVERRRQPGDVLVAAAHVDHAAARRHGAVAHVGEEVAEPLQVLAHLPGCWRCSRNTARRCGGRYSCCARRRPRVGRLVVVAFLVPAPGILLAAEAGDVGHVLRHVREVGAGLRCPAP